MKTTHEPPQFELPIISREAFNLAGEVAVDGERVRREMADAEQKAREAEEIEKKQQPTIL